MSSSESAALGACLAQGVNTRKMQFRIEEILGNTISVKLEGEAKATTIFECQEITKVKYMRKGSFNLEVLENGIKIGVIRISKKETDSPESIAVRVKISPFLTFEVEGVDGGTETQFKYESCALSTERQAEIQKIEDSYRHGEMEIKVLGEKRNFLENLMDSFDSSINKVFLVY